jgi:tRNA U38,U39,U40 pseudouridine synthase TruA
LSEDSFFFQNFAFWNFWEMKMNFLKDYWKVKVLMNLSYIGEQYSGFQVMGVPNPTVQGAFLGALEKIQLRDVKFHTGSRTDAKVNAVAHPV